MSLSSTPNKLFDRLLEGQGQAEVSFNASMNRLDTLVHLSVIDRDLTAPPGDPSNGDIYIVGASATGVWNGKDGQVAGYYSGWMFTPVLKGFRLWIEDENVYLVWDGTEYKSIMLETGRESFALPPLAEATTLLGGISAAGNSAPTDQPEYPVNVRCELTGTFGSADLSVVITGTLADGTVTTETILIVGGDADYDGVKAFAKITDIAYSGDFDSGGLDFSNGTKLGISHKSVASVFKEVFNGLDQVLGTFNAANATYIPTGTLDGLKPLELWYKTEQFV